MGYYMGDYYIGRPLGDPGIGSFFGGLVKSAVGLIPGVGPIASKAIGLIGAAATKGRAIVKPVSGVIMRHPVITAAGAAGTIGAGVLASRGARPAITPEGGGIMRGYHISRKTGKMVRNRHMNVCNPRALRRSIRRAHGFAKFAMKAIHLTMPKKKGHFGGFKRRRKKK